eukprot:2725957-Pleurochrysis_carterae.AAC.4
MGHVALVVRLGAGGCAHNGLRHGCHLLTQLAQLVAQGGHVIFSSDGLGAHGAAVGVNGVLGSELARAGDLTNRRRPVG